MLGAYIGYSISHRLGFWPALVLAPLVVGVLGAWFERACLRHVHRFGHVPELLLSFGLSYVLLEAVQLIWGRLALDFAPPPVLQGPAFTLVQHSQTGLHLVWGAVPADLCSVGNAAVHVACSPFPATRAFMALVAVGMLGAIALLFTRTRLGLVIQAALTHPRAVEALGHNVPRVFMLVFGAGSALAGLAGVIGGSTYLTEPAMAASVGSIIFVVVVVGGMGSLSGAFLASLMIGVLQTFAIAFDYSLGSLAGQWGWALDDSVRTSSLARLSLSQVAPLLPYLILVLMLLLRPRGLLGQQES
jgi:branched-chain amino acid transport system permease protein